MAMDKSIQEILTKYENRVKLLFEEMKAEILTITGTEAAQGKLDEPREDLVVDLAND